MSKYSEANVITFNGGELELELRNRNPDYYSIIPKLLVEKNASYGILTLGSDGLIVFDKLGNFEKVPAFATSVIDKIGAGDAVFAMASLLAKIEAPLKVIGFLSNLMAAHEVSQSGHSVALTKKDLLKHSRAMLS
jgi:bifunctional ADP-heptose synthase (sugar kinase/adenylyltransferase)